MKKMFLLLFAVMLVSSMAYAGNTQINFTIGCANFFVTRYTPSPGTVPKKFLTGVLDESGCGRNNEGLGGFQHGNPLSIAPYVSPVDDFSLPFYGLYGYPWSVQYLVTEKIPCVFASYVSNGAQNYFFNYGSCSRFSADRKPPAGVAGKVAGRPLPTPSGIR